jgi:surface antigen
MFLLPLDTQVSIEQKTINLLTEKPPAIVQVVEPTLDEKIRTNYYKCREDIEWIRADDATCLPKQQQTTTTTQSTVKSAPSGPQGSSSSNLYATRNCTWYAKSRRPDLPNNLGDSISWAYNAAAQGFAIGSTPKAGSIGQQGMHVVYIEAVNGDGTVYLSEMNYDYNGGFRYRTANASDFTYIY